MKVLGRRTLEVTYPEAADAHEAKLLEREERDAQAATRLTDVRRRPRQVPRQVHPRPPSRARRSRRPLAIAAPKHQASKGPLGERRPTPQRLGLASASTSHRFPAKRLPKPAASTPASWS